MDVSVSRWCFSLSLSLSLKSVKNIYNLKGGFKKKIFVDQDVKPALAGVAQWIECGPAKQRVTGLIPSQGSYLGFGPGPW